MKEKENAAGKRREKTNKRNELERNKRETEIILKKRINEIHFLHISWESYLKQFV